MLLHINIFIYQYIKLFTIIFVYIFICLNICYFCPVNCVNIKIDISLYYYLFIYLYRNDIESSEALQRQNKEKRRVNLQSKSKKIIIEQKLKAENKKRIKQINIYKTSNYEIYLNRNKNINTYIFKYINK